MVCGGPRFCRITTSTSTSTTTTAASIKYHDLKNIKLKKNQVQVLPRFELGSQDSES